MAEPTEPTELAELAEAEQAEQEMTENEPEGMELRPQGTLEFPDRRDERNRRGMIKFRLENGVPDVGGLGWRSRAGHLLKNQTFYASRPGENQWNNPTHAGPRTWRNYHGPKLRTDADLMERMDRIEAQHAQWEAKKAFVNTVRVQTLDRFYGRKIENEQKEMASQWAPHRRARGEYHKYHETMTSNLDNMPMKELKKVLTPTVLHGDREAIRSITKRIQTEETWKVAWKHMELARRAETQADFEHRMTYNAMLMELAGQAPRPHNPPRASSPCSPTLAGLAQPQQPKLITNITKRSDYRGLVHVDHAAALESRFPGCGHNLATTFSSDVSVKSKPAFPAPEPPATPVPQKMAATTGSIRKGSVPVSQKRLHGVGRRQDPSLLAEHSQHQFLPTSAPPAPDQGKMLLQEPNAVDSLHMSLEFPPRSDHTSQSGSLHSKDSISKLEHAPPSRPMVYPVTVSNVEDDMQDPDWRPKRTHGALASATPREQALQSSRTERWPPVGSQTVDVTIIGAEGLPRADRRGHSDPYVIVQVPGRSRSRAKTTALPDTETPVWNQMLAVPGWRRGEPLIVQVLDADLVGSDDLLASVEVPSAQFFPNGFEGRLEMQNLWVPDGETIVADDLYQFNLACRPIIELKIALRDDVYTGDRPAISYQEAEQAVTMPGAQPSLGAICAHLDNFEAALKPVPRLGNFWVSPR
ncbi:Pla2g4d [Symbiodinium sp. KB8]|nr:Pla2g4d [Symbiodinium sp. KB8]